MTVEGAWMIWAMGCIPLIVLTAALNDSSNTTQPRAARVMLYLSILWIAPVLLATLFKIIIAVTLL